LGIPFLSSGAFYPPFIYMPNNAPVTASSMTANAVYAVQFVLPFVAQVNLVGVRLVTAGGASSKFNVGLYDFSKNKLIEISADATLTTPQFVTPSIGNNTILAAGVYWLAWSASNTTMRVSGITQPGSSEIFQAAATPFAGVSSNAMASNVLPSSLGTISAGASAQLPLVFMGAN
jgi:hypothetical protein